MKNLPVPAVIIIILAASFAILNCSFKKGSERQNIPGNTKGFAVVELFTSEGCSSCPAADEALETVSNTYKENVYLLGFHVDYWNRLGWKDAFSNGLYSERQRSYARLFGKEGVYTPQVIVNGTEQFVGSDLDRLNNEIKKELTAGDNFPPVITVTNVTNKQVEVSYAGKENSNTILNIALVQLHAVTNVKNGENEGRTLSHVNIVRDFKTITTKNASGKINLDIPAALTASDCKVIAYVQDVNTFKITSAAEIAALK